jgi:hypothetical protein
MSDTISRQAAIDAMKSIKDSICEQQAIDALCELPAVQTCDDAVSRQALMKEFSDFVRASNNSDFAQTPTWNDAVSLVGSMPSARPEVKEIGYAECASAMIKMWIDNVLTDCEYNRVMNRLNAHYNSGMRRTESEV